MGIVGSTLNLAVNPSAAITGISVLGGALKNLYGIAAGVAVAFAGWKVTQATFQSMKTAESQIIRLQTALQNTKKGVDMYNKAMKFAAETPFPVESVIDAAVALKTFQFDPFKEVDKGGRNLLKVLGDMAGATGNELTTATLALNKALVGEWEVMQNNFQISAKTIPKLAGLASGSKAYGDAIIEALVKTDRFRGGMDKTAKSMSGMLSNVKDGIDILFMGIGGVAESMGETMKGLTLYDSVKSAIEELYTAVSDSNDILNENGEIIERGISQGDKIKRMGQGIGQVFKFLFDKIIKPLFVYFAKGIRYILESTEKFFSRLASGQAKVFGLTQQATKIFSESATVYLAKTAKETSKAINDASSETRAYLSKLGITATKTNEEIQSALRASFLESKDSASKGLLIFVILASIIGDIIKKRAQDFVTFMQPAKKEALSLGDVIFGAIGNRTEEGVTYATTFLQGFSGWFENLRGGVTSVSSAFGNLVNLLDQVISDISDYGSGSGSALGALAGIVGGVLLDAFAAVINVVTAFFKLMSTGVPAVHMVFQVLKGAFNIIKALIMGVVGIFTGDFQPAIDAMADVMTNILNFWVGIRLAVLQVFGSVMDLVEGVLNVADAVGSVFGATKKLAPGFSKNETAIFEKYFMQLDTQDFATIGGRKIESNMKNVGRYTNLKNKADERAADEKAAAKELEEAAKNASVTPIQKSSLNPKDQKELVRQTTKETTDVLKNSTDRTIKENKINTDKIVSALEKGGSRPGDARIVFLDPTRLPMTPKDIGEWNVPSDTSAFIHRGEMIIPANDAESIRKLFGYDSPSNMKSRGSLLMQQLANYSAIRNFVGNSGGKKDSADGKPVIINQHFYGKAGTGTASMQMKSSAKELVGAIGLM